MRRWLQVNRCRISPSARAAGQSYSVTPPHLVYELARRNSRLAIGSACIGGGQGMAVLLERI
jgi:hypothetical protein